jgi:DNA helicase HerA-like ATPase
MKVLGTVISGLESPSTGEFYFVVGSRDVRKGQYVQVGDAAEPIVATVSDLFSANRYFERPESIAEYEKNFARTGGSFFDHFPVGDWEYLVAKCAVQGKYSKGKPPLRVSFPPSPGSKVAEAPHEAISEFLQLDPEGLHLGRMLAHDLDVRVGLGKLLQKHLAILAMSGAGKSVLATVIIEELLSRQKERGRLGVVVFDVHGEYACFADKRRNFEWAQKTEVIDARKVRIATKRLATKAAEYLPDLSPAQARELSRVISYLKDTRVDEEKNPVPFDLSDVRSRIEQDGEIKDSVKGPLLASVEQLMSLRLFAKNDYPKARDVVRPGGLTVFDLSTFTNQRRRQIIVAYFASRLFAQRHREKIPPFALFVEEAHNFAREHSAKGESASRHAIERIAREGRKFGACLVLVSQRPAYLSTTALAQCNTFCVLRVTNPNDIKHIGESCEAMDAGALAQITTLRVGEGVIIGEAVGSPVFVRFRLPRSARAGKPGGLEDMAKKFESSPGAVLSDSDLDAFV